MEIVSSVPVAQQAMTIMMMSLFSRSSVCFSVCLRMHLRTPKITKISWGSMPPDSPKVNNWRVTMFFTSAKDIAPPRWKTLYVRPCIHCFHSNTTVFKLNANQCGSISGSLTRTAKVVRRQSQLNSQTFIHYDHNSSLWNSDLK